MESRTNAYDVLGVMASKHERARELHEQLREIDALLWAHYHQKKEAEEAEGLHGFPATFGGLLSRRDRVVFRLLSVLSDEDLVKYGLTEEKGHEA